MYHISETSKPTLLKMLEPLKTLAPFSPGLRTSTHLGPAAPRQLQQAEGLVDVLPLSDRHGHRLRRGEEGVVHQGLAERVRRGVFLVREAVRLVERHLKSFAVVQGVVKN